MDPTMLVSDEIQDGQKLVDEIVRRGIVVTTAGWIRRDEELTWRLCIAMPEVDTLGLGEAYRRLHPILYQMPEPFSLDPRVVLLVSPNDSIAAGIEEFQQHQPVRRSMRYNGPPVGRIPAECAYVYTPKA